jgi:hypothetical protein
MAHLATRAVALLAAVLASSGVSLISAAEPSRLECVATWGEARYRNIGYDHLVHVQNHCDRDVLCDVSTDVNPEPEHVTVVKGTEVEVLTFRGSPAREFKVIANCKYP